MILFASFCVAPFDPLSSISLFRIQASQISRLANLELNLLERVNFDPSCPAAGRVGSPAQRLGCVACVDVDLLYPPCFASYGASSTSSPKWVTSSLKVPFKALRVLNLGRAVKGRNEAVLRDSAAMKAASSRNVSPLPSVQNLKMAVLPSRLLVNL